MRSLIPQVKWEVKSNPHWKRPYLKTQEHLAHVVGAQDQEVEVVHDQEVEVVLVVHVQGAEYQTLKYLIQFPSLKDQDGLLLEVLGLEVEAQVVVDLQEVIPPILHA